MLGAIIGDVIGSAYEKTGLKDYNFELFSEKSRFTDDTVLTLAVAETIMHPDVYHSNYQIPLVHWATRYPNRGYGKGFREWLKDPGNAEPSHGNGSAMRVSPIGFAFDGDETILEQAYLSAKCSHNTPDGIKGAKAVALAVGMARVLHFNPQCKGMMIEDLEGRFGYDLKTPIEKFQPDYQFDATCAGSVPQAIRCFIESVDFESAIRLAVSLGGDADTQASIAGAIAQAFYKQIPERFIFETFARLPQDFVDKILLFQQATDVRLSP